MAILPALRRVPTGPSASSPSSSNLPAILHKAILHKATRRKATRRPGCNSKPTPWPPPGACTRRWEFPTPTRPRSPQGLLQIFVGTFGVGRFYTGHTGLAIGQLVACLVGVWILSWFTCGISALVVFWPLIDGIVLLASDSQDAQGRLLR